MISDPQIDSTRLPDGFELVGDQSNALPPGFELVPNSKPSFSVPSGYTARKDVGFSTPVTPFGVQEVPQGFGGMENTVESKVGSLQGEGTTNIKSGINKAAEIALSASPLGMVKSMYDELSGNTQKQGEVKNTLSDIQGSVAFMDEGKRAALKKYADALDLSETMRGNLETILNPAKTPYVDKNKVVEAKKSGKVDESYGDKAKASAVAAVDADPLMKAAITAIKFMGDRGAMVVTKQEADDLVNSFYNTYVGDKIPTLDEKDIIRQAAGIEEDLGGIVVGGLAGGAVMLPELLAVGLLTDGAGTAGEAIGAMRTFGKSRGLLNAIAKDAIIKSSKTGIDFMARNAVFSGETSDKEKRDSFVNGFAWSMGGNLVGNVFAHTFGTSLMKDFGVRSRIANGALKVTIGTTGGAVGGTVAGLVQGQKLSDSAGQGFAMGFIFSLAHLGGASKEKLVREQTQKAVDRGLVAKEDAPHIIDALMKASNSESILKVIENTRKNIESLRDPLGVAKVSINAKDEYPLKSVNELIKESPNGNETRSAKASEGATQEKGQIKSGEIGGQELNKDGINASLGNEANAELLGGQLDGGIEAGKIGQSIDEALHAQQGYSLEELNKKSSDIFTSAARELSSDRESVDYFKKIANDPNHEWQQEAQQILDAMKGDESAAQERSYHINVGQDAVIASKKAGAMFKRMVEVLGRDDSDSILYQWSEAQLNESGDGIKIEGQFRRNALRGKGDVIRGKKSEFMNWLHSDAPFDESIYGKDIRSDKEYVDLVNKARSASLGENIIENQSFKGTSYVKEGQDAVTVRENAGQIRSTGNESQGGQNKGGENLQQQAQIQSGDEKLRLEDQRQKEQTQSGGVGQKAIDLLKDITGKTKDLFSTKVLPRLTKAGVNTMAAIEHAYARIYTKPFVGDLLARVFPEDYHDKAKMSSYMDILAKNNIAGGYYKLWKDAQKETNLAKKQEIESRMADIVKHQDMEAILKELIAATKDKFMLKSGENWNTFVVPKMDEMYNEMKGVDKNTPREGRGLFPQLGERVNLLSLEHEGEMAGFSDPNTPMPETRYSNYTNPNVKRDKFMREAQLTGKYSTDPEAVLTNSFGKRINETSKLRFYSALVDAGVAQFDENPGKLKGKDVIGLAAKIPETNSETGLTRNVDRMLYVQKDLASEIRGVLNTDLRLEPSPTAQAVTGVQLISTVDATSHLSNELKTLAYSLERDRGFKAIMNAIPGLSIANAATKIGGVIGELMADTRKTRSEKAFLSKNGMLRQHYPSTGIQKITKIQDFISINDTAGRILMNREFDNLIEQGLAKDDMRNRRDFVQQIGEYNRRLMGEWERDLKDRGWSPFIVAGKNYNRNAIRIATGSPGFKAASTTAAIRLRATRLAGLVAAGVVPMMANLATTGTIWGRAGTPVGAIDLGPNFDTDNKDNPKIKDHTLIDVFQLTGIRRGLRALGLNAAIKGVKNKDTANEAAGNALEEVGQTVMHPYIGPAVGFFIKAWSGERADLRGGNDENKLRKKGIVGIRRNIEWAKEGAKEVNPLIYSFVSAFGEKSVGGGFKNIGHALIDQPAGSIGIKKILPLNETKKLKNQIQMEKNRIKTGN